MPETVIFDTETDGLLPSMTKLHMIQAGSADGDDVVLYCDTAPPEEVEKARGMGLKADIRPIAEGLARLRDAERTVAHNFVSFDWDVLERFHHGVVPFHRGVDTLITSRLLEPGERRHRLKDWGERLGVAKGDYTGDFRRIDAELLVYAEQDVVVGRALWHHTKQVLDWKDVYGIEHRFQRYLALQERNGFTLDVAAAEELAAELRVAGEEVRAALVAQFPPLERTQVFIPKVNNKARGYVKGVPFTKRWTEEFNPASRAHIAERLQMLGWKPKAYGKDGVPTVDETVLAGMKHPAAKQLLEFTSVQKRLAQLSDGKTGWLKMAAPDGRVHGRVNNIGCEPGRCSHSNPNLGNVNKKDKRMRGVWVPRAGWRLIGVDGDGIQARALAHYLHPYDGGRFADRLINGDKKTRTDIHSANLAELVKVGAVPLRLDAEQEVWDSGRDHVAKRALYASWFGAQNPKIGWTVKDGLRAMSLPTPRIADAELGGLVRLALNRAIVGLDKLSDRLRTTAKSRGYLISPAGRHIPIRSMHSILVFLMQATEADIMKVTAGDFLFEVMPDQGWEFGIDVAFCAHVHDEAQIEAREEIAEAVGDAYAACIDRAAEKLGLRCPHKGSKKIGLNWAETH